MKHLYSLMSLIYADFQCEISVILLRNQNGCSRRENREMVQSFAQKSFPYWNSQKKAVWSVQVVSPTGRGSGIEALFTGKNAHTVKFLRTGSFWTLHKKSQQANKVSFINLHDIGNREWCSFLGRTFGSKNNLLNAMLWTSKN